MDNIINLCASLVLTLISFVLPILTILLSLFSEGTKALTAKYENEKKQSDNNITNELEKKGKAADLDYDSLEKNLKILKKNKKNAESKLGYLKPAKLIIKISIPLVISFVSIILLFGRLYLWFTVVLISISVISFVFSLYFIWKSILVLIEVTAVVSESKRNSDDKIIELLSRIAEKNNEDSLFLKPEKINIKFDKKSLEENSIFKFPINANRPISISIHNSGDIMAKNIEIGFIFPPDFLVEKTNNISSIYIEDNQQIIRFRQEFIRQNENNLQGDMKVTFLKAGTHNITAFIKGENVKNKYTKFKIEVVD